MKAKDALDTLGTILSQDEGRDAVMDCPHCGEECVRDEVDIGVGVTCGPYGCYSCGWSEWKPDPIPGYYIDPCGGATSIDSIVENAERFGLDGEVVRKAFEDK